MSPSPSSAVCGCSPHSDGRAQGLKSGRGCSSPNSTSSHFDEVGPRGQKGRPQPKGPCGVVCGCCSVGPLGPLAQDSPPTPPPPNTPRGGGGGSLRALSFWFLSKTALKNRPLVPRLGLVLPRWWNQPRLITLFRVLDGPTRSYQDLRASKQQAKHAQNVRKSELRRGAWNLAQMSVSVSVSVKYNHTKFEQETQRRRPARGVVSGGPRFQNLSKMPQIADVCPWSGPYG